METSSIIIDVSLGKDKVPEKIKWKAAGSTADEYQQAKAFMVAFWDGAEKTALRMDLWTKEMMVDEMADFFYQTMMTMADTFNRATHMQDLTDDMKNFSKSFYNKFKASQISENKS